jgi:hypothetical protein
MEAIDIATMPWREKARLLRSVLFKVASIIKRPDGIAQRTAGGSDCGFA